MNRENRNALRRCERARKFPENTCRASRHVFIIADYLGRGEAYGMIEENPEYVAADLFSVIEDLWKARTEIDRLKKQAGEA